MEGGALIQRLPKLSAEIVAAAGWAAMKRGKRVVVPGVQNKVFAFLPRLAPRAFVAWVAGIFLRRR
jgi:short-subunit dehydrogenase